MMRAAKTDFAGSQAASNTGTPSARQLRKRAKKYTRTKKTVARRIVDEGRGIRETEEARALLEEQLHSLYWWAFNAFKMKGFIRAKALDEVQRVCASGSETPAEQRDPD
jgi:hypothetical protein